MEGRGTKEREGDCKVGKHLDVCRIVCEGSGGGDSRQLPDIR